MKYCPLSSTDSHIGSFGFCSSSPFTVSAAVGRLIWMEWVSTGMVIMNTISKTSITSTSGVTLMSLTGESSPPSCMEKDMIYSLSFLFNI